MNWVAVQPYYKINRVVDGIEQRTEEQGREMFLYEDRIVTKYRSSRSSRSLICRIGLWEMAVVSYICTPSKACILTR